MTAPKLELIGLSKEYDDGAVVAVDGIDLQIAAGETVALLGPSGCGKSTTLNMVVGLEEPSGGDIRIDGSSVIGVPPGRRHVGLVFQDYAVFTHMSVARNLSFGLEVAGLGRAEIAQRVGEVAELLGLQDMLREKAATLGGSQLQRVAIGRTLVTRPALLLLDEPLSNLEAEARLAMRRELRRLQSETGLTIVYVTHDQTEAISLANRIAVMSNGRIRQFDATQSVYDDPAHVFVAGFIGSPAMNLVKGDLKGGPSGSVFTRDGLQLGLEHRFADRVPSHPTRVVLGFRPDAVRLSDKAGKGFAGRVTLVAPRGPEAVVTLEVHGIEITAIVPAIGRPDDGADVTVEIPPDACVLFSTETGRNLSTGEPLGAAA